MTPAIPGDNLTESPLLLAGEIAGRRGWVDAAVALPDEFEHLAPSGSPVVAVVAAGEVDTPPRWPRGGFRACLVNPPGGLPQPVGQDTA